MIPRANSACLSQKVNFRVYENGVEQTTETFGIANAPPSFAMQAASPLATPAGTFGLLPMPSTAQTPTTYALRVGNMNLGALAVWVVKHARAFRVGGFATRR